MALSKREGSPIHGDKDDFTAKTRSYLDDKFREMWQKCRPSGADQVNCTGGKIVFCTMKPTIEPFCSCGVCQAFLKEVLDVHVNGPYPILIPWSNSDVSQWGEDPWQIAKLFLGIDSYVPKKLESADLDSLITIIDRCNLFEVSMDESRKLKYVSEMMKHIEKVGESDVMREKLRTIIKELEGFFRKDIRPINTGEQVRKQQSGKRATPAKPNGAGHPDHIAKRTRGKLTTHTNIAVC